MRRQGERESKMRTATGRGTDEKRLCDMCSVATSHTNSVSVFEGLSPRDAWVPRNPPNGRGSEASPTQRHASRVATEPDQENHLIDRVSSSGDVENGAELSASEPVVRKIFLDIRQASIFAHSDGHGKQRKGRVHECCRDERFMKTAKRHAHTCEPLVFCATSSRFSARVRFCSRAK